MSPDRRIPLDHEGMQAVIAAHKRRFWPKGEITAAHGFLDRVPLGTVTITDNIGPTTMAVGDGWAGMVCLTISRPEDSDDAETTDAKSKPMAFAPATLMCFDGGTA